MGDVAELVSDDRAQDRLVGAVDEVVVEDHRRLDPMPST
jgi:hypothetical protein